LQRPRPRVFQVILLAVAAAVVLGLAGYTVISLQPHVNPSGQASSDPNERCAPSPCGAPAGFEVDVIAVQPQADHIALTVVFRNHTKSQLFEAVSYRHTSPADFVLRAGRVELQPVFNADCPNWPELDVPRGATSAPRTLCFDVSSPSGAVLVWNPDLGFISEPVSIALH
jgi:hypothetical protein